MACTTDSTLPPDPSKPGKTKTALAGQAYSAGLQKQNYADPKGSFTIDKDSYKFGDKMAVKIAGETYVYNTGYYYDKIGAWKTFKFTGTAVKNWIQGTATASVDISKDKFPGGKGYVVAYACKKVSGKWNCHGNQWMAHEFSLPCITDKDCDTGKQCFEGSCIDLPEGPTGIPGKCVNGTLTGKWTCKEENYNFLAYPKYYNETCGVETDKSPNHCGWSWKKLSDACHEDHGCCDIKQDELKCENNVLINRTKNSCTGEINKFDFDCTSVKSLKYPHTYGRTNNQLVKAKSFTCAKKSYGEYGLGCFEKCEAGKKIYKCTGSVVEAHTCYSDGFGYKSGQVETLKSCPTGTKCQNGFCS